MGEDTCNEISDKGLVSKNLQRTYQTQNLKNPNNPIKKWAEDLNRQLSKENTQMNRHMKR